MSFPSNTLNMKKVTHLQMEPMQRQESIEIVGESFIESPQPTPRRNFRKMSTRSTSRINVRYNPTLTPSKMFKWQAMTDETGTRSKISTRYFHAICYRASVTRRCRDLRLETMDWKKFHMVVFDDVIVFFNASSFDFDSRLHMASIRTLRRVRIAGKSTTYFGTVKPFVVRFQTSSSRNQFRKVMKGQLEPNRSVNLSTVDAPVETVPQPEEISDDDVFLPVSTTQNHPTPTPVPRRRIRSLPEPSRRVRLVSSSKLNFRSLRKFTSKKKSGSKMENARKGFLETIRQKSKALKKKFSTLN